LVFHFFLLFILLYITPNKKSSLISSQILKSVLNTDIHLATAFCNYFSTITNSFKFFHIHICLHFVNNFFNNNPLLSTFKNKDVGFNLPEFTREEIVKGLKALAPNSGKGESDIESSILIEAADALGKPLTDLFNLILKTGIYPNEWKCAHITPIFKGGKKTDLGNYRPISILSPISKLFESLVSTKIIEYLERNNMLHRSQFAYRKNTSTEHAVLTMTEEWRKNLDKGFDVVALFIDLSKAFDTVDHNILLAKLKHYNFHPNFIRLIKNYLEDRSIKVKVNDSLSESCPIKVGVPQGSVLGPLLFIIYFNDFNYLQTKSKNFLYADDTTMSSFGKHIDLIIKDLESDLFLVEEWLLHNRLLINWKKTQAIHFSRSPRSKDIALNNNPNVDLSQHKYINFNHKNIKFVRTFKLLGVIVDNRLNFEDHTVSICKKVNSITGLLKKGSYLFTDKIKPTLFKLFIMNRFEYCGVTWLHSINQVCLDHLEKCFAKSILRFLRINIFSDKLTVKDKFIILSKFNILPLKYRLLFHYCTFLFNLIINKNIFFTNNENYAKNLHNTRNRYVENKFKTNYGQFSFITISTKLLNNTLIAEHFDKGSLLTFKRFLRDKFNLLNLFDLAAKYWT